MMRPRRGAFLAAPSGPEGVEATEAAMRETTQAVIVAAGITWSLAGLTGLVLLLMAVLVLGLEVFTDSGIGV
jgi:diacylglycerol kinase